MLRFCVFSGREDVLLVLAPDGHAGPLPLPAFAAPFTKAGVSAACDAAGIRATGIETFPGRWTRALGDARAAEAGARGSQARAQEALHTQIMLGSIDPSERDRAKVVARLQGIQVEHQEVKRRIAAAAAERARTGLSLPQAEIAALREREATLTQEMLGVQAQLTELRKARHAANMEKNESFARRFVRAAKETLDRETFDDLLAAAEEDDEGEEMAGAGRTPK
jgi:hypothetical protein